MIRAYRQKAPPIYAEQYRKNEPWPKVVQKGAYVFIQEEARRVRIKDGDYIIYKSDHNNLPIDDWVVSIRSPGAFEYHHELAEER